MLFEQVWVVRAQHSAAAEPEEVRVLRRERRAKLRGSGESTCEEDKRSVRNGCDGAQGVVRKVGEKGLARGQGGGVGKKICGSSV